MRSPDSARNYRWGENVEAQSNVEQAYAAAMGFGVDRATYDFACPCGEHKARIILHPDRWSWYMSEEGFCVERSIRCCGIWQREGCDAHYYIRGGRYVKVSE